MNAMTMRHWRNPLALGLLILAGGAGVVQAQTEQQIRLAFENIRSDTIPHNGEMAAGWLFKYRNRLHTALLDELYKSDRQGRDVIMTTLFKVRGFRPDARFYQLMMTRINEEERYVGNWSLGLSAHWACWKYVHEHYAALKPFMLENLEKTDSMLCVWSTVWMLSAHGDLDAELPKFSERVWKLAERSLANDKVGWNAGQAVRFYLIIGKPALPRLQAAKKSSDQQTQDLAAATIDAIGGNRRAYGYLGSTVNVELDPVTTGKSRPIPEWMHGEVKKWVESRGKYQ